ARSAGPQLFAIANVALREMKVASEAPSASCRRRNPPGIHFVGNLQATAVFPIARRGVLRALSYPPQSALQKRHRYNWSMKELLLGVVNPSTTLGIDSAEAITLGFVRRV